MDFNAFLKKPSLDGVKYVHLHLEERDKVKGKAVGKELAALGEVIVAVNGVAPGIVIRDTLAPVASTSRKRKGNRHVKPAATKKKKMTPKRVAEMNLKNFESATSAGGHYIVPRNGAFMRLLFSLQYAHV